MNGYFYFYCPHCKQKMKCTIDMIEKDYQCPTCGKTFKVEKEIKEEKIKYPFVVYVLEFLAYLSFPAMGLAFLFFLVLLVCGGGDYKIVCALSLLGSSVVWGIFYFFLSTLLKLLAKIEINTRKEK